MSDYSLAHISSFVFILLVNYSSVYSRVLKNSSTPQSFLGASVCTFYPECSHFPVSVPFSKNAMCQGDKPSAAPFHRNPSLTLPVGNIIFLGTVNPHSFLGNLKPSKDLGLLLRIPASLER